MHIHAINPEIMFKRCLISLFCMLYAVFAGGAVDFNNNRVRIDFDFVAVSGGKNYPGNGYVTYQDGAFIYRSGAISVYNDTNLMWTVNDSSDEVTLEKGGSDDLFSNPSKMVEMFGFNPKGAVIETTKDADGNLTGFNVVLKNNKSLNLVFTKVKLTPKGPLSDFSYDKSRIPDGYVFTDLR